MDNTYHFSHQKKEEQLEYLISNPYILLPTHLRHPSSHPEESGSRSGPISDPRILPLAKGNLTIPTYPKYHKIHASQPTRKRTTPGQTQLALIHMGRSRTVVVTYDL